MQNTKNGQPIRSCHVRLARRYCAALFCAALAVACAKKQEQQQPAPVEVGAIQVQPNGLPLAMEHAAQLRGVREVEVRARVSGILMKKLYHEGSRVKANDLLFKIDPAPFQAEAERARAEVGVQKANLQQAERDRARIVELYQQKLVSVKDRDAAIAADESASANVAAAEAALRTAQLNLSYTDVRAPIDGLTSREVRSEGSLVTAGSDSSLLTHIVQADRLYVQFSVPDAEAERLRAATQGPDAGKVSVRVTDIQGKVLADGARIEFIAPSIGDGTGTVDVRAVFDNKSQNLTPGQVVRAHVEGVTLADSLVIPKRAIMHGLQGSFVWVIGPDNKVAAPRPIELGMTSGNNVAVANGLEPGDRVVVDGILKVHPGAAVKVQPPAGEAAPPQPPERQAAASESKAPS
jgi:membrane fusion protein (multidrug efflux system)